MSTFAILTLWRAPFVLFLEQECASVVKAKMITNVTRIQSQVADCDVRYVNLDPLLPLYIDRLILYRIDKSVRSIDKIKWIGVIVGDWIPLHPSIIRYRSTDDYNACHWGVLSKLHACVFRSSALENGLGPRFFCKRRKSFNVRSFTD